MGIGFHEELTHQGFVLPNGRVVALYVHDQQAHVRRESRVEGNERGELRACHPQVVRDLRHIDGRHRAVFEVQQVGFAVGALEFKHPKAARADFVAVDKGMRLGSSGGKTAITTEITALLASRSAAKTLNNENVARLLAPQGSIE